MFLFFNLFAIQFLNIYTYYVYFLIDYSVKLAIVFYLFKTIISND